MDHHAAGEWAVSPKDPILFKARVLRGFRSLLDAEGFVELSTPLIRRHDDIGSLSGAELRPRMRVGDGWYLRDSPAFALRYNLRLAEKIFEMGPCFRQDDIDTTHLPEFTMLDLYWRGASLEDAVSLAERLVRLFYHGPVERLSVAERFRQEAGIDLFSDELGEEHLHQYLSAKYSTSDTSYLVLLDRYIKEEIEPLSKGCCLIVWDFPLVAEARARRKEGALYVADRVEFQIDGIEIIHAYTDEPDPSVLIARAEAADSLKPEDELMAELLERGVVPSESSGFGIGIERFCQVCLGVSDIRQFMASKLFSIPEVD